MYRFTRGDIPLYQYISTYNIIDNRCNINILVKWLSAVYIYIAYIIAYLQLTANV